jgi:hypothetical protein
MTPKTKTAQQRVCARSVKIPNSSAQKPARYSVYNLCLPFVVVLAIPHPAIHNPQHRNTNLLKQRSNLAFRLKACATHC